jgi:2-polyprenyl-3-methyl-5-hydroxy-6-metoxy-1,4-benzoquinol methylase
MHQNCLICNSEKLEELKGYEKFHLCQCKKCNFVFAKKIPTLQELEEHYDGYGRNDYLSPITIKRYNQILDKFEEYRETGNLLDVGCGIGLFLEVAKKRGWNVYGTEYTDEAIRICKSKGIQMKKGKLNPADFEGIEFDVLTSVEVLEHINNPIEELNNFNKLLRTNGIVYATTPNFNSLLRYKLKQAYNVICYPEHLSYYTPKTITNVFKKCGFSKVKIETTGISITRLKTSQKKSTQAFVSKESDDEVLRNKMENNKLLGLAKKIINTSLTIAGKGDSLKVTFKKK